MIYSENKLTLAEGDSLSLSVLVEEDEAPKDLTGYTLFFSIKRLPTDPDRRSLLKLQVPHQEIFPPGVFPLTASSAQMQQVKAGAFYYDLRLVNGGSVVTLAAASPLEVVEVVTKDVSL